MLMLFFVVLHVCWKWSQYLWKMGFLIQEPDGDEIAVALFIENIEITDRLVLEEILRIPQSQPPT